MKERRRYGKTAFWWILLGITIAVVWMTQRVFPFMMDDQWYSTLLYSDEPIRSFRDILSAQIWHYFNWGGRSIAHTILQMILLKGELAADIANTVTIVFLAFLATAVAGRKSVPFVCIAVSLLHALNANWKMSMYWQAGASNYLYITCFVLLFMFCYLRKLSEEEKKDPAGISLFILPLGLCAGWSNENMGPVAWLLTIGVIWWRHRQKRKVRPWMAAGSTACLAGSVLVIAAPGNFVRSQQVASNEYGLLWNAFLRGYSVSRAALDYLFLPVLLTAAVIFIHVFVQNGRLDRKEIALLAGAVLSWGAMILSPHYPDRAVFGTMVLLLCVILSQTGKILEEGKNRKISLGVAGAGLLLWLRGMYFLGEYITLMWGWIR